MSVPYPVLLIDILTTTPQYISSKNLFVGAIEYRRRLTDENASRIQKELSDLEGNQKWPSNVELKIANAKGYLTQLNATQELQGVAVKIKSYDITTATTVNEYRGWITDKKLGDTATLVISVPDPLKTKLPLRVLTNDDFASDRPEVSYRPSRDLGMAITIPLGYVSKSRLLSIYDDLDNDHYDYLIGYAGTDGIESNNSNKSTTVNVYRGHAVVTNTEYTVYDGTQVSPYNGFAFIRFIKPQYDTSGNYYELHIDCRGLKMGGSTAERNFIRAIQGMLSNTSWGISQTVNAASFDAAVAIQIGTQGGNPIYMSSLKCDSNGITEQRDVIDIISELQEIARAHLYTNIDGEWCIRVDTYLAADSATFGHRDTYWKNIFKLGELQYSSFTDRWKSVQVRYRYNPWNTEYAHESEKKTIFSSGSDLVIESPFIRDHATADMHACYIQKKSLIADEKLPVTVGREGSTLVEGEDAVTVKVPRAAYDLDTRYKVISVDRSIKDWQFDLMLEKHTSAIYEYTPAADLPTDEVGDNPIDYSQTNPDNPTNFAVTGTGTYMGSDGTIHSYINVHADIPAVNACRVLFGQRAMGDEIFNIVSGFPPSGDDPTWNGRLDGLVPNKIYDLSAYAENIYGLRSSGVYLLGDEVTGGETTAAEDTEAPNTPTGLISTAGAASITLSWNNNTEKDLRWYEVYRDTVPGDFNVASILQFDTGENNIGGSVFDQANGFIYLGVGTVSDPPSGAYGVVKKIDISDFTIDDTLTLSMVGTPMSPVIDTVNGFLYFLVDTGSPNNLVVVKIDLDTFTEVDTLEVSSGYYGFSEQSVIDMASSPPSGFAYWGIDTSPPRIIKLQLADFSLASPLILNASDDAPRSAIIDTFYGYAYFGMDMSPGRIVRVRLSDFTRNAVLNFASGENGNHTAGFDSKRNVGYFGIDDLKVIKVSTYSFTRLDDLTLTGLTGTGGIVGCAIDLSNDYIYFMDDDTSINIAQVDLDDFTQSNTFSGWGSDVGGIAGQANIIDANAQYGYIGYSNTPGGFGRADLLPGS